MRFKKSVGEHKKQPNSFKIKPHVWTWKEKQDLEHTKTLTKHDYFSEFFTLIIFLLLGIKKNCTFLTLK